MGHPASSTSQAKRSPARSTFSQVIHLDISHATMLFGKRTWSGKATGRLDTAIRRFCESAFFKKSIFERNKIFLPVGQPLYSD